MRAKLLTLTSALALACAGLATSAGAVGNHGGTPGPSAFMRSGGGGGRAIAPGGGGMAHAMRPQGGEFRGQRAERGELRGHIDNDRRVRGAWNGDRDHDGDHDRNWRHHHGVFLSFGEGYYSDDYNSGGGCGYAYRRWQYTGSPYWYHRYLDCIG